MSLLFRKPAQPREFTFRPQYYKPDSEEVDEKGRRRLHFPRILRHPPPQKKPVTRFFLIFVLLAVLFWYMRARMETRPIKVESIRVEEIN